MEVVVKRDDVVYTCRSEEQLRLFLEAGYTKVEDKPKKKKVEKK